MTKTAIVILNWNGLELLKKFLPVMVIRSQQPGTEIYLADNGSTDGSADWVENNLPRVKTIRLDSNYGFAGGYNRALDIIDAEYFVLVNADIEVTDNWLEPLIGYLDSHPLAGACQPKILSYNDRGSFEYAGAAGGYIDTLGYTFCRGRIFFLVEHDRGQYNDAADIFWTSGACMAVRADAWKKCGGLDADFFAHMEEIDLCWRLNMAGYTLRYIPDSAVYHIGGSALPYESPYKTYLNFRNNLFLLYKNLPDKNFRIKLFFRKILDGLAAIRYLLHLQPDNFISVWRAHLDYYKSKGSLKEKRREVRYLSKGKRINTILNKSLVFEFYVMRNRTFDMLKMNL